MCQSEPEKVNDFAAELRRLASTCDFGQFLQDALRDRFVCGLSNAAIQKKLLSQKELTFTKAIEIAQAMEAAAAHSAALHSQAVYRPEPSDIHVVHKSAAAPSLSSVGAKPNNHQKCFRCGRQHSSTDCPYKLYRCNHCKKLGHLSAVCRSRGKHISSSNKFVTSDTDQNEQVNHSSPSRNGSEPYMISVTVEGKPVVF